MTATDEPRIDAGGRARAAVALHYASGMRQAPKVVAKGHGEIAEAILAFARAHDVPVRDDPDLVELLGRCDVGDEIPLELYTAVARILTYLYRTNRALSGDSTAT